MKRNKPTMRRWIYALFIAALCGNIAACGDKDEDNTPNYNPNVHQWPRNGYLWHKLRTRL